MKLGAVDIGSNAIRFQITSVLESGKNVSFKKLEYVRFPLRLGQDVFKNNEISTEKEAKFIKLMQTFKNLFDLYEVDDFVICATSAMRESKNGRDIAYKVKYLLGIDIHIIEGEAEANLINKVLFNELDNESYLHIDVGGGSTEINIFVNKKKVATNSFKIGTGGNIGKIYELANPGVKGKAGNKQMISLHKIEEIQDFIASHNYEERINKLMLNPDRADVIIPASEIYTSAMRFGKSTKMMVPELGLKDGLMLMLYEKNKKGKHKTIVSVNKFAK
ncbi:MAG: phosphatase [Cytophagaceae bacterium]|nr:phosphatase [Cytophagaceae bacterium]